MFDTLSEKERQELEIWFTHYGANDPFLDYVHSRWSTVYPRGLPAIKQSHPDWDDQQVEAASFQRFMDGYPVLVRGLAKRLREDAPEHLARSASIYARFRLWWGTRNERDCFLNFSNDMLIALAAGDTFVIERFANTAPTTATKGPWAERLLHAGIVATILRDEQLLADAVREY